MILFWDIVSMRNPNPREGFGFVPNESIVISGPKSYVRFKVSFTMYFA